MNIFNMSIKDGEKQIDNLINSMSKEELLRMLQKHGAIEKNTYYMKQTFYTLNEKKYGFWYKLGQLLTIKKKNKINSSIQEAA